MNKSWRGDQPEQQNVWDSHCRPPCHPPHPPGLPLQEGGLRSVWETLPAGSAVKACALIQSVKQKCFLLLIKI